MRKFIMLLAVVCFGSIFAGLAQAQDRIEIFGGYSYVHQSTLLAVESTPCPLGGSVGAGVGVPSGILLCPIQVSNTYPSLNGWEVTGAYNVHKWLGIAADFGGNYGSVGGVSFHHFTYMVGPQIRYHGKISPFAHILFGGARESVIPTSTSPGVIIFGSTVNEFAMAVGGGVDIRITHSISLRAVQVDYLLTHTGSQTFSQPRISAGLVFHF